MRETSSNIKLRVTVNANNLYSARSKASRHFGHSNFSLAETRDRYNILEYWTEYTFVED